MFSDFNVHSTIIQGIDDKQLEGSSFQLQEIEEAVIEKYKVNDIKASWWIELPRQNESSQSSIKIKNKDQLCFMVYLRPSSHS